MGAFNGAFEGTCKDRDDREGCAAAIAWTAVKRAGFRKGEGDQWVKTAKGSCPRLVPYLLAEARPLDPSGATVPRAILNTLDRFKRLVRDGKPYTIWFGAEAFKNTLDQWAGIPIVYVPKGQDHPDAYGLQDDPEAALKKVNGTVVGHVSEAMIPDGGEPRIEVSMPIDDPKVLALWRDGKLTLSTAFLADEKPMPGMKGGELALEGNIEPNHVLVFERTPHDQPGDGGAVFLNKVTMAKTNFVPDNPPGYGTADEGTEWTAPNLGDFTDKRWSDLPEDERSAIARHYAFVGDLDEFGSLKLPHHDPKTHSVVWNGVRAAMAVLGGARGGASIPSGEEGAIRTHLESHYKDFKKPIEKPIEKEKERMTEKTTEDRIAVLEKQIEVMKAVSTEKDGLIAEKETLLKEQAAKKAKEEWDGLAKELPRALVHGAKEIETREKFYAGPAVFMKEVLIMVREQHEEALKVAGQMAVHANKAPERSKALCTGITVNGQQVTE